MMQLTELIDELIERKLPFVSYCLPGETVPVSLIGSHFSDAKPEDDDCFVVAAFDASLPNHIQVLKPSLRLAGWTVSQEISELVFNNPLRHTHEPEIPAVADFNTYKKQFEELKLDLVSGKLKKVVLSRVIRHALKVDSKPSLIFKKLTEKYPLAFVYILNDPSGCLWMGATPETLIRTNQKQGFTMSLAGTQALHSAMPRDLVWGPKEIAEQQFVTDYIGGKLQAAGVENTQIGDAETITAGNIAHLCTKFSFSLPSHIETIDIALALHPTPAVCGLPLTVAFDAILKAELHKRALYCGFLGHLNKNGYSHLFVNLRCMQIIGTNAYIYVGGGLTADSELMNEWEETRMKAETLTAVIRE